MKNYLIILISILFIYTSCSTSRSTIANTPEDRNLLAAIKKINKNSSGENAEQTLSNLYRQASTLHLDNIEVYATLAEADKWSKIIREYEALQQLTNVINGSAAAKGILDAPDYTARMEAVREHAASDYYSIGQNQLQNNDKESYRNAYEAFKMAEGFVPGYKDSKKKKEMAFQNSLLNVVVNPVNDNSSYYSNIGWNRYGNSFNDDYLQRNLVRDLGGDYTKSGSARFYTDWEAQRSDITSDLFVDLTWVNLDIPYPYTSNYSRNVSRQIQIGADTSGHTLYQTVTGTLYITRKYFTATGDLESRVTDASTRNTVDSKRYTSQFNWQQEYATYRGDQRALSGSELSMLGSNTFRIPNKEDILTELYQRIYPQVKNGIYNSVRW
ncbi:MAG: hypothetical protein ABIR19_00490 [Ginsengibacter sp.]